MHRDSDLIIQTQEHKDANGDAHGNARAHAHENTPGDALLRAHLLDNAQVSVEPYLSGMENMRRDEDNAMRLLDNPSSNVYVRLYSWDPWCISLGANQREDDIDHDRRAGLGFDCVRRATGGRAVFHAHELTYSITMVLPQGIGMHDVYRVSHHLICEALHVMGARTVSFQKTQTDFASRYRTDGDSVSCFTSAARSELMWNDKKVVGSAQRVYGNVLLQHGSILLSSAHLQLVDCLRLDSESTRQRLRESLQRHSVSLDEILGHDVTVKACADALSTVFLSGQKSK